MTKYDVCLSFAEEDREYVDEVNLHLKDLGVVSFHDDKVTVWGEDLTAYLDRVYRKDSRFCVMFISRHYARGMWAVHQRRSALARGVTDPEKPYVLPARFDDTEVDGLLPTVGYIDLRTLSPRKLAEMIAEKVGKDVPAQAAGWEYRLFADTLRAGLKDLEDKRHDHDLPPVRTLRTFGTEAQAFEYFVERTEEFDRIINSIAEVLSPQQQERAFGAPNQPGDDARIRRLGKRFTEIYEQLLDWAADLLATATPSSHRALYLATARLADGPLDQIDAFAKEFAASVARQPAEPVELRLVIDYSLADVETELAKVQTT